MHAARSPLTVVLSSNRCASPSCPLHAPFIDIFGFAKIAIPLSLLLNLSLTRWALQLVFHNRLRSASLGVATTQSTERLMARLDKLEVPAPLRPVPPAKPLHPPP